MRKTGLVNLILRVHIASNRGRINLFNRILSLEVRVGRNKGSKESNEAYSHKDDTFVESRDDQFCKEIGRIKDE